MSLAADLLASLRFFSRLPLPHASAATATPLAEAATMVPVAGVVIGAVPALVLFGAVLLGLSPPLAAALAIAALVSATGALHEDGLADCADGFGGGAIAPRKLEIMRDSRIGTFGACALVLSLLVRVVALTDTTSQALSAGAFALLLTAPLSRTLCLLPLVLLPPARLDGLGVAARKPAPAKLAAAFAVVVAIAAALAILGASPARLASAIVLASAGALGVCALAWRQIGGQTGDVAGATQQIAEIAALLAFAAS